MDYLKIFKMIFLKCFPSLVFHTVLLFCSYIGDESKQFKSTKFGEKGDFPSVFTLQQILLT